MFKVILTNYDFDDESYLAAMERFEMDFAIGRDGLREWESPIPPVLEEYYRDFNTREEAEMYSKQNDVQEYFENIQIIDLDS